MPMQSDLARAAWECAWVLWMDFRDRLTEAQRSRMLHFTFMDDEDLTSKDGAEIFALYGEITGERRV